MAKNYRIVSQIVERPNRKPFFNKVGIAYDNRDGSINFNLLFFPGVQLHVGLPKEVNGEEPPDAPPSEGGKPPFLS
jgi:hypothetical protein